MLPILQKYFSLTFLKEGLAEQIAVDKSHSAHRINPGPVDSALLKDCVAQVLVASNKRFIKIVHCYLLEAGKEKQAEEYLQKVSLHLGSNTWTVELPYSAIPGVQGNGRYGIRHKSFQFSSCLQHHPTFFPLRHLTGGLARLWPTDEAGMFPETEGSPSTAVEPTLSTSFFTLVRLRPSMMDGCG
ncbi:unnamed protein product [Prunus armeniaca]|uniref:Uncharacterized protein n=1 Tax=Prunus armeniaca TaxID=36596 RepID=A0A6J5U198_PRUAR|nr:unnamed protein product [Prunus armeniaca]